jgi:hypothetical protein
LPPFFAGFFAAFFAAFLAGFFLVAISVPLQSLVTLSGYTVFYEQNIPTTICFS